MSAPLISGVDHIDIVVEDTERMAEFLIALGFTVIRRTAGARGSIELRFPGEGDQPFIELTPSTTPDGKTRPLGLRHLAVRAPDLEETYSVLSARGYRFNGPPRQVGDTGRTLTNLIDPEGNPLQIVSAS